MNLKQLAKRFKIANQISKCKKCGDENPYMDFDPNYVCRQCKTRAKMWGGEEEKPTLQPQIMPVHSNAILKEFINEIADHFTNDGLKIHRTNNGIQIVDKNRDVFANLDDFMDHIVNTIFDFKLQGAGPPEKDNVFIYFDYSSGQPSLKQKALDNLRVIVHNAQFDQSGNNDDFFVNIDFIEK